MTIVTLGIIQRSYLLIIYKLFRLIIYVIGIE